VVDSDEQGDSTKFKCTLETVVCYPFNKMNTLIEDLITEKIIESDAETVQYDSGDSDGSDQNIVNKDMDYADMD
jgi:hypothetical protein